MKEIIKKSLQTLTRNDRIWRWNKKTAYGHGETKMNIDELENLLAAIESLKLQRKEINKQIKAYIRQILNRKPE